MPRVKDMIGFRSGRLLVVGRGEVREGNPHAHWLCQCDCGGTASVNGTLLRALKTMSCGCITKERGRASLTTHGHSRSPEYMVWIGLRSRCNNKRSKDYANYGGRGIKVCARWDSDFMAFLADMGPRPSGEHSVERSDNNGDYEPTNCYWGTRVEQSNNRRTNVRVIFGGRELSMKEYADALGVSYHCAWNRHRKATKAIHG
jgi:hypothetical protein